MILQAVVDFKMSHYLGKELLESFTYEDFIDDDERITFDDLPPSQQLICLTELKKQFNDAVDNLTKEILKDD